MAVFYTSGGVDGNAGLNLDGMLSSNFVLQYCTNLAGPNWMNLLSLSMRSVQRASLVIQRGAPEQVFVLGVGVGDLGREQVELRLVELDDRTDAVAIARLGEVKGLFGVVQELGGDALALVYTNQATKNGWLILLARICLVLFFLLEIIAESIAHP